MPKPWWVRLADRMADNGAWMVGEGRRRSPEPMNFTGPPARVELLNLIFDATVTSTLPNWWAAELMPAIWRYEEAMRIADPLVSPPQSEEATK